MMVWSVVALVYLFESSTAFVPSRHLQRKAVLPLRSRSKPVAEYVHEGLKCDCCGVDPIVGVRFACSNVADVDLCSACVTRSGQTFGAGGLSFEQLTWSANTGGSATTAPPAPAPQRPAAVVSTRATPAASSAVPVAAAKTAPKTYREPVTGGEGLLASAKAPAPAPTRGPSADWGSSSGVSGLYQSRDQAAGSAARRQAEANRRLLEQGNAELTPEQEEKRLAYLHAQSCVEN